ncbi:MAG: TetR/AcrR family transcriptional regulator [Candidatus Zixiibacteriota bacterium]
MSGKRMPELTRRALLAAAYDEIYRRGFQAASLESILKEADLTKGALYHHFPSKLELGYAVVDEIIRPMMRAQWVDKMAGDTDTIQILQIIASDLSVLVGWECLHLGSPLANLAHEMSPLDEGFRSRISGLYSELHLILTYAIERGQRNGFVRKSIDPLRVAAFIIASVEGALCLMKNTMDKNLLVDCGQELLRYLDNLREPQTEPVRQTAP